MKRAAAIVAVLMLQPVPASAACEPVEALLREYGISYTGFERSPPITAAPRWNEWPREDYRFMPLPRNDRVRDGYNHSILVNAKLRQAWINRTGGFAGVHEWYGPVPIDVVDLRQCDIR
jgi:hypothetical protein